MVIAKGITLNRVTNPNNKNTEQSTSANTASPNDIAGDKPRKGKNWTGPGEKNIISFGNPCVSIKDAIATLPINNARLPVSDVVFTVNNFFMIIFFDNF